MSVEYDDQDGHPIREYSSTPPCPSCIISLVYLGHGDYTELTECYCKTVFEPQEPGWEKER